MQEPGMFAAGLFTGLIVGVILTGTSLWAWQAYMRSQGFKRSRGNGNGKGGLKGTTGEPLSDDETWTRSSPQ
eukprot:CAMPEP_0206137628 /NCGR_PEP_ID=MMETSP1473-20131121/2720_1 /ASSEMBLY_ACC=CAM_ASM_001109 /TAXON_ID=1461547 /ORGANISM="Stichococcus sp, Strain RCC1054" /LENGTH=71 /DNA_ID=CAMNT_0053530809 /DNA_START=241 /DNA_END=456 /DNA_ORIENTATION=-